MMVLAVFAAAAMCALLVQCAGVWDRWRSESAAAESIRVKHDQDRRAAEVVAQEFSVRLARGDSFFERRFWVQAADEYQAAWEHGVTFACQQVNKALAANLACGRYAAAQRIGETALGKINKKSSDAQWVPLYTTLALLGQGRRVEAHAFTGKAVLEFSVGDWPYPILLYLNGELPAAQLESEAGNYQNRKTEALTFIGCEALYTGDIVRAREALRWVVEKGDRNYIEMAIAEGEYARIKIPETPAAAAEQNRPARIVDSQSDEQMKGKPLSEGGLEAIGAFWLKNATNRPFAFQLVGQDGWQAKTVPANSTIFITSSYQIAIRWKVNDHYVKSQIRYYVQRYYSFNGFNPSALRQIAPVQIVSLTADGAFQINESNR